MPFTEAIDDLHRAMSATERYQRLIACLQAVIVCDAVVLLKLEAAFLKPVAAIGLKDEAMARRFSVERHPRLQQIMAAPVHVRFDADSDLPDPYDGLVDDGKSELLVHDCMGAPIVIDGKIWGVLTFDAMQAGSFDQIHPSEIEAYVAAASALIKTSQHIEMLTLRAEHNHEVAHRLTEGNFETALIGRSDAVQVMRGEINTVAPSDLSVLITGETGVGKELVACGIHQQSARSDEVMVQINCAALPESIVESELFGHVKGAFSGASTDRSGRFELADGGSLFLDEVGELSLSVQAKLLRALQSGEIQRVGSDEMLTVDVRLIAATNRDLQVAVKEGRFRADLYHRLSVYPLPVPPLRERDNDYVLLAGYFLEQCQHKLGVNKIRLSAQALHAMSSYDWPGNVRELEHLLSRAALKAARGRGGARDVISIEAKHLDLDIVGPTASHTAPAMREDFGLENRVEVMGMREAMDHYQRHLIQNVLAKHQNKLAPSARELKLDRSNLVRLMERLGVIL